MGARRNVSWIIGVVALSLIAAAWFFVSPLFIDEPVDEKLPFATGETSDFPPRAEIDAMSTEQRAQVMKDVMAEAAARPDHEMREPMALPTSI